MLVKANKKKEKLLRLYHLFLQMCFNLSTSLTYFTSPDDALMF